MIIILLISRVRLLVEMRRILSLTVNFGGINQVMANTSPLTQFVHSPPRIVHQSMPFYGLVESPLPYVQVFHSGNFGGIDTSF